MIDLKTKKRIIVQIDPKYGPFIVISNWEDVDALEDVLSDTYDILFFQSDLDDLTSDGGCVFYFGSVANAELLQTILDGVMLYLD